MMNAHLLKQTSVTLIPYAPILTVPMFAAASEDTWAMVLVVQVFILTNCSVIQSCDYRS